MGLRIALQTESGEQLGCVADEKKLLGKLIGYPDWQSYPMLASIDRYGDTYFNTLQISHFLIEWSSLYDKAFTEEEQKLLAAVKKLAEQQGIHEYLVFIGD